MLQDRINDALDTTADSIRNLVNVDIVGIDAMADHCRSALSCLDLTRHVWIAAGRSLELLRLVDYVMCQAKGEVPEAADKLTEHAQYLQSMIAWELAEVADRSNQQ